MTKTKTKTMTGKISNKISPLDYDYAISKSLQILQPIVVKHRTKNKTLHFTVCKR